MRNIHSSSLVRDEDTLKDKEANRHFKRLFIKLQLACNFKGTIYYLKQGCIFIILDRHQNISLVFIQLESEIKLFKK